MMNQRPLREDCDVAIIGGALSGAAVAILLLREQPGLRVVIVERSERFARRVGEATVEVSTYFLQRCLGLTEHLHSQHLVKNGLRFWFANAQTGTLADCSEVGGRYLSRLPAYLVDRAVLDEEALRQATRMGAELWRPATVLEVQLTEGEGGRLRVARGGGECELRARWVMDASGVAAMLSRRNGWWRANEAHPTVAAWSRWSGVKSFDSREIAERYPAWSAACYGMRGTATNHLMGTGWWAWWIPLRQGDVSIGVVFDARLVDWPTGGALGDRIKEFLCRHPVGRELMAEARWQEGDVHWRKHLPYSSSTYAGNGFALVGDAAAFLDPFYSPGLDWVTYTAWNATRLVLAERRGEKIEPAIQALNASLSRSYERWFEAIYRDKYEYFGDADLLATAFVMDVGLYYLGVASQPYRRGDKALAESYFATAPSVPIYHLMRTYNRRLVQMARARRARGVAGCRNAGWRRLIGGFALGPATLWPVGRAFLGWLGLELREGWRTWFSAGEKRSRAVWPKAESESATAH